MAFFRYLLQVNITLRSNRRAAQIFSLQISIPEGQFDFEYQQPQGRFDYWIYHKPKVKWTGSYIITIQNVNLTKLSSTTASLQTIYKMKFGKSSFINHKNYISTYRTSAPSCRIDLIPQVWASSSAFENFYINTNNCKDSKYNFSWTKFWALSKAIFLDYMLRFPKINSLTAF